MVPACSLRLYPSTIATYYPCGGFYGLELEARGLADLGAFETCVGYDDSRASLVGFAANLGFLESTARHFSCLGPVACLSTCQTAGKKVGAWSFGTNPGPSGDGTLGQLSFWRNFDGTVTDSVCLSDWELVNTEFPPGIIEVAEAARARISHRSFCYGDFNDDGEVTVADIMQVSGRWGCCEGEACYADTFDVNLIEPGNYCMSVPDSCIDVVDVQEVAARWGRGCPGVVQAPHFPEEADQKLKVSPDTLVVPADGRGTATLDLVVEDGYDLGAFEMTLEFDPSVVQVEGVVIGDFLSATGRAVYGLGPQINNETGRVRFGAWTTGEDSGTAGGGAIAHVVLSGRGENRETAVRIMHPVLTYTHGWPQPGPEVESGIVKTAVATSVSGSTGVIPKSYALFANVPNPFNPTTIIGFAVPKPGPVTITVLDVSGRQVAVLARGEFRAGEFSKTWDGRDIDGREVASGVYFVRMEAEDFRATRKMALLR